MALDDTSRRHETENAPQRSLDLGATTPAGGCAKERGSAKTKNRCGCAKERGADKGVDLCAHTRAMSHSRTAARATHVCPSTEAAQGMPITRAETAVAKVWQLHHHGRTLSLSEGCALEQKLRKHSKRQSACISAPSSRI